MLFISTGPRPQWLWNKWKTVERQIPLPGMSHSFHSCGQYVTFSFLNRISLSLPPSPSLPLSKFLLSPPSFSYMIQWCNANQIPRDKSISVSAQPLEQRLVFYNIHPSPSFSIPGSFQTAHQWCMRMQMSSTSYKTHTHTHTVHITPMKKRFW